MKLAKLSRHHVMFMNSESFKRWEKAPTSGTLPRALIILKLVAKLPIKKQHDRSWYEIVVCCHFQCGWIQRPFRRHFNCQSGAMTQRAHPQKLVSERSPRSLFIKPPGNRRGVYLAAISEGWGSWKMWRVHAEICKSPWQFVRLLFQMLSSFLIWKWPRLQFGSFSRLCLTGTR